MVTGSSAFLAACSASRAFAMSANALRSATSAAFSASYDDPPSRDTFDETGLVLVRSEFPRPSAFASDLVRRLPSL